MLNIDTTQLDAFRTARLTGLATRLDRRARTLHPRIMANLTEAQRLAIMKTVIESALAHGLKSESLIERFCDLSMVLGVGFETSQDWARDIFAKRATTPERRLRDAEASAVFIIRKG